MAVNGISPNILSNSSKLKVKIICEGLEERQYINTLISFGKWNENLLVIPLDAGGINNVYDLFSHEWLKGDGTKFIFILCDTGKEQKESRKVFLKIREKIDQDYKNHASDKIVVFANPITMQIFLSHFTLPNVIHENKKENQEYIEKVSGVIGYKGRRESISKLMKQIRLAPHSYETMRLNVKLLEGPYLKEGATNASMMFDHLEDDDTSWIDNIMNEIMDE